MSHAICRCLECVNMLKWEVVMFFVVSCESVDSNQYDLISLVMLVVANVHVILKSVTWMCGNGELV